MCRSGIPENSRFRPSLLLEAAGKNIVIDTAPEFRLQALTYGLRRLDALLFTHAHADHIFGFDDIRRFNQIQRQPIPVYASAETLSQLKHHFGYAFDLGVENWALPRAQAFEVSGKFSLFGQECEAMLVYHGNLPVTAFRLGDFAYVTDCSEIPADTMSRLKGLDVLVLDALRYRPHSTHLCVDEAVRIVQTLQPQRAYFTHLCHEVEHRQLAAALPPGMEPAYDGLVVEVNSPATTDA